MLFVVVWPLPNLGFAQQCGKLPISIKYLYVYIVRRTLFFNGCNDEHLI